MGLRLSLNLCRSVASEQGNHGHRATWKKLVELGFFHCEGLICFEQNICSVVCGVRSRLDSSTSSSQVVRTISWHLGQPNSLSRLKRMRSLGKWTFGQTPRAASTFVFRLVISPSAGLMLPSCFGAMAPLNHNYERVGLCHIIF